MNKRTIVLIVILITLVFAGMYSWTTMRVSRVAPVLQEGIYGEVILVSDVSTIPDSPIEGTQIFAFVASAPQVATFATTSRFILMESVKDIEMKKATTDRSGNYTLPLKSGTWIVCVKYQEGLLLSMCRSLRIEEKKAGNVSFYFGEGSSVYCKDIVCEEVNKNTDDNGGVIDVANWKIYNNEEYGFEFKYPKNTKIEEEKGSIVVSWNDQIENPENPVLFITIINTEGLSIESVFDGKKARKIDFKNECIGKAVVGREAYMCLPTVSFAGESLIIIPYNNQRIIQITNFFDSPTSTKIFSSLKFIEPAPPVPAAVIGSLLQLEIDGGMCVYGGCWSKVLLNGDGAFEFSTGNTPKKVGVVPKVDIGALAALIEKANFATIRSNKFTGTCPIAYDGTEITYTFYTPHGKEVIKSCTTAVDVSSPLFSKINEIVKTVYASQ